MTEDKDLWLEYIKTVKKIKNNSKLNKSYNLDKNKHKQHTSEVQENEFISFNNFIFATKNRRRKNPCIEGKIDLHGLTEDEAFTKLNNFLKLACCNHKRNVLVITGKGKNNKPGVIKLAVPRWLSYTKLAEYVSKYSMAEIDQGGEGAILVSLKTKSKKGDFSNE